MVADRGFWRPRKNRIPHARNLVGGEVFHHHHVAWRERRDECLLDMGAERIAGVRAIDDEYETMPVLRSPAMNVGVRQYPNGVASITRSLGPHP